MIIYNKYVDFTVLYYKILLNTKTLKMKKQILAKLRELMGDKKALILAGHFPLVSFEDKVFPGIYQDINCRYKKLFLFTEKNKKLSKFLLEIFKTSLELLINESKILLLVDDKRLSKKSIKRFYQNNQIPLSFELELARNKRCPTDSIWTSNLGITSNKSSRMVSEKKLIKNFKKSEYSSCSLEHGCAQEFYPLLHEVVKTDFEIMVNFIPASCTKPILEATQEFYISTVGSTELHIINVFVEGSLSEIEMWNHAEVYDNKNELIKL